MIILEWPFYLRKCSIFCISITFFAPFLDLFILLLIKHLYLQISLILVVVDYFSQFIWARGYETANPESIYDFWLHCLVSAFGFPCCIFHDNGSHFIGAKITTFFKSYHTTQIRAPISYPSLVGLVERNIHFVISQVKK